MRYLYAAYLLTWGIHIAYLLTLLAGILRLRREWDELTRK